jgi:alpha-tubulin suppressor-like RCC1 family protein
MGYKGDCWAVKTDGTLWAWGINNKGQLGLGNTTDYSSPVQVGSLTDWKLVGGAIWNNAAIKTDGTLWTCGYAAVGMLGNGTATPDISSPAQVGSDTDWISIGNNQGWSTGAIRSA